MEKKLSIVRKIKEVKKNKKFNNNKGFSLIELLIVIAIMGVLAVIAFNMFGGVLTNSKKRADDQQALVIQKAILAFCVDSGDWTLTKASTDAAGTSKVKDADPSTDELITAMLNEIYVDGKSYGPMLAPKFPDKNNNATENIQAYTLPQWNTGAYGTDAYAGFDIEIWPNKQAVKVTPVKTLQSVQIHTS